MAQLLNLKFFLYLYWLGAGSSPLKASRRNVTSYVILKNENSLTQGDLKKENMEKKYWEIIIENCKNDDRSSDCLYLTIKQYITDKLDKNTVEEIRGEKFYLKIKFDKNGKIDSNSFECSLSNKKEIFLKLIENIKVNKAAELNNEKIDMTYSIPIQIE